MGTATLRALLSSVDPVRIRSNPEVRGDLWTDGPASEVLLADFFARGAPREVILGD